MWLHKSGNCLLFSGAWNAPTWLGGIFLGRVWYPPQAPKWANKQHYIDAQQSHLKSAVMPLKYQCDIWHDELHALAQQKADILVTHGDGAE
ncbi:MAG: hypothetical protein ABL884_02770 [Methyloglobulus sp.]